MKHSPAATEPIILECDLPQAPALVWRALTEPDLLGAWLLPNDLRPQSGARFCFERADRPADDAFRGARPRGAQDPGAQDPGAQDPGERARGDSIECEVLQVEPNKTLRWRQTEQGDAGSNWQAVTSVVTIELTDLAGGGTHLRLVHGEFSIVATLAGQASAAMSTLQAAVIPFRPRSPVARRPTDAVCQLRRVA